MASLEMGFESGEDSKMLRLKVLKHKRSKSFPEKKIIVDDLDTPAEASNREKLDMKHLMDSLVSRNKESTKSQMHNSMKQEILLLEKRLQDQFQVRFALEKALGYRSTNNYDANVHDTAMPKPAIELIKEIAVLEVEVVHLEQYLLSLYRKAFDGQSSSVSPSAKHKSLKSPLTTPRNKLLDVKEPKRMSKRETPALQSICQSHENPPGAPNGIGEEETLLDSSVQRCHSSLSQHFIVPTRNSPSAESLAKVAHERYSQPLSMLEYAQNASSNIISLAEHLGTHISDHFLETPNRLSEDMIKCMSTIFCKLSDPLLAHNGLSSPNSSLSSASGFSPRDHDLCSLNFRNYSSFDVRLDNPFHVERLEEFSGPYSTMIEVPWIYRENRELGDIQHLLQDYRSLICRLEKVDPKKLKHGEKIAFWINVHNALVMHAFLAYGIPQNNVKRVFLLLKVSYNIGGHVISADTIRSCILGCHMSRPGQWLHLLLSPRAKFQRRDKGQAYAVDNPEPLLHFALCTGSHSDPAIHVYTPKRVCQELEAAKKEYIRATFSVRKDHKIILPKLVESFAKDSGLCPAGVLEMIQQNLPESLRKSVKKCQLGKSRKNIEWIPHNYNFRYLISKELVIK